MATSWKLNISLSYKSIFSEDILYIPQTPFLAAFEKTKIKSTELIKQNLFLVNNAKKLILTLFGSLKKIKPFSEKIFFFCFGLNVFAMFPPQGTKCVTD